MSILSIDCNYVILKHLKSSQWKRHMRNSIIKTKCMPRQIFSNRFEILPVLAYWSRAVHSKGTAVVTLIRVVRHLSQDIDKSITTFRLASVGAECRVVKFSCVIFRTSALTWTHFVSGAFDSCFEVSKNCFDEGSLVIIIVPCLVVFSLWSHWR